MRISEVGPHDGLQSPERTMATADQCTWIDALHAAGLREIEGGCSVAATRLPQRADEAGVVRHARSLPGLTVLALVPNLRRRSGWRSAPTAFGRALQGRADVDEVINLAGQRVAAGADDCGLSHTTGMANTAQWRRLSTRLRAALGERARRVGQRDPRGRAATGLCPTGR